MGVRRLCAIVAAGVALLSACGAGADREPPPPSPTTQAQRQSLAAHAIGINSVYYEAQRAGVKAADSQALFPGVWKWKEPGYPNVCSEAVKTLKPADQASVDFPNEAGYFEAGNAVLVTGPMAFSATQMSIGALQFMKPLENMTPRNVMGDSAGCLEGGFTKQSLAALLMRQIRYFAATLSNAIMVTRADNSEFKMLIGVADSDTYGSIAYPSWEAPPAYQQKCYIADLDNPAADVAAQAAAGLAMTAKVLATHGTAADKQKVKQYAIEAARTYEYAKKMWLDLGVDSICFRSTALNNCVGSGCSKLEEDGDPVLTPCMLYLNKKDPQEYLFIAAAALYALTGKAYYRGDADVMWPKGTAETTVQRTFLYNWNNVLAQGTIILAAQPDLPGMLRSRDFYRNYLRATAELWSRCSNDGEAIANYYRFCERTEDGSTYPLDMPWGNLGMTMNGMCAVGMYQALGYDAPNSPLRRSSACFIQRQLGYIFNHKCDDRGSACYTQTPDGFSYMVGIGRHYTTQVHSRDAAYPYFYNYAKANVGTLCGGLVSGPYARKAPTDGPVRNGTDEFEDDRKLWQASEAAIDYTSSLVCTLMSYATMPDSLFDGCPARTPFTGRGPV